MEKSVLEMIGGEKHINPHYDIKAESSSCYHSSEGFTGIEINGVRLSNINIREMLIYMNKQRDRIVELEKENAELQGSLELYESGCCRAEKECAIKEQLAQAKEIIKGLLPCCRNYPQENAKKIKQAEQFLRENDIDNAIRQANEGLDLDKIADEVEQDIKEGCPDTLCENCKKEDCTVRKLGLVPDKE